MREITLELKYDHGPLSKSNFLCEKFILDYFAKYVGNTKLALRKLLVSFYLAINKYRKSKTTKIFMRWMNLV